ncbi:VWA domain-containing protein [Thioalkalivibrio sp. ALE16]|uniref:VWA domain-containing protein n=1 Tax=Thioalkalivibrio sp. ALE16 TaxID=1158172 RepID=UPI0003A10B39|nr:VWA domain-containing protein [Thioalkalivibrio sp. ALE16]
MLQQHLKRSFHLTAHALAGAMGVKVTFGGKKAYATAGKRINLPQLPANAERGRVLGLGYLVHEVSHLYETDFEWLKGLSPIRKKLHNIVEDHRIEQAVMRRYPGAKGILTDTREALHEEGKLGAATTSESDAVVLLNATLAILNSSLYAGCSKVIEDAAQPSIDALQEQFPLLDMKAYLDLLHEADTLADTRAALDLTDRLIDLVIGEQPQEDASSNEGSDNTEEKSEESDDQEESDGGEGESDSDSSEDENGSGEASTNGESKEDPDQEEKDDSSSEEGTDDGADSEDPEEDSNDEDSDGASDDGEDSEEEDDPEASSGDEDEDETEESGEPEDADKGSASDEDSQKDGEDSASDQDTSEEGGDQLPTREELDEQADEVDETYDLGDQVNDELEEACNEDFRKNGYSGQSLLPGGFCQESPAGNGLGDRYVQDAGAASSVLRMRLERQFQAVNRTRRRPERKGTRLSGRHLVNAFNGDARIFERKFEQSTPNTAVQILVDRSGSMAEEIQTAMTAAMAIQLATDSLRGVTTQVSAFPGRDASIPGGGLIPVTMFGQPARLRADSFAISAGGGTPMSQAILGTLSSLLSCREPRKILLVITDGAPDNFPATEEAIRIAREDVGVESYAIGVGTDPSDLFGDDHTAVISTVDDLAHKLFEMLSPVLTGTAA